MIVSPCSKCEAPMIWCVSTNGKKMPLDADPDEDGTFLLVESPDNGDLLAVFHKRALEYMSQRELEEALRYTSHFATCPDADRFRRRG